MSERIIVTGGTGFIGEHLVSKLAREGKDVTVLKHSQTLSESVQTSDIRTDEGDITEFDKLPSFEEYDTVVHLAGKVSVSDSIKNPRNTFKANIHGTENVLERARLDDINKVLYLSSASVYGDPESLPISEEVTTSPLHPYAASKLAGENMVEAYTHSYDMNSVSARVFTVYGPGQKSDNLVPEVIQQLERGVDVVELGNIEPTRDFIYVKDVAKAIITLLNNLEEGYDVYNIGSGNENSVEKIVRQLLIAKGSTATIDSSTGRKDDIEIERMVSDSTKLRNLGWEPEYDLEKGIRATIREQK